MWKQNLGREVQPFFNEDDLFGRGKDKQNLIELLMHLGNVNNIASFLCRYRRFEKDHSSSIGVK